MSFIKKQKGFSSIEVLIILIILGALMVQMFKFSASCDKITDYGSN